MYVRIQASFLCKCKLAMSKIYIRALPCFSWNITFVLVSSIKENVELVSLFCLFLCLKVLFWRYCDLRTFTQKGLFLGKNIYCGIIIGPR